MIKINDVQIYITEELFKEITLKACLKNIFSLSSLFFMSLYTILLSVCFLLSWSFDLKMIISTAIYILFLFTISTVPLSFVVVYSFYNKKYKDIPLNAIFKNKIMSLDEQEHYFEKVKSLGLSVDEINLFITKKMKFLNFDFGNKLVMLLALDDAINYIKKQETIIHNKNIIKTYFE